MRKNRRKAGGRRGTILFTGSWVQDMPFPNGTSYCASKGGQQMLAKVMAQELARDGINVSLVAPGMVCDAEMSTPSAVRLSRETAPRSSEPKRPT